MDGKGGLLSTALRWPIILLLLTTAVLLAGSGWFYVAQNKRAEAAVAEDLSAMAALKVDQITQWRSERLGDAAVLRAVPGSPWFVVAREDAAEILAAWRSRSILRIAMLFVLLAAAAAAFVAVWQRDQKNRYRLQYESEAMRRAAEERYRITLLSVGDGVISTDADARVQLVNPVAESLTGWRQEEACGKRLEEIFQIMNEETRQPVENPVSRVMREGTVVGLEKDSLLVDREGRERSIADTAAPIRDRDGRVVGTVLVFRDVTGELRERRERETTLNLLRLLNTHNLTHELVRDITGLLQTWTGCDAVGVRLKHGDDFPYYETRGFSGDFVEAERYLCERDARGNIIRDDAFNPVLDCMCGAVLRGRFDPKQPFFTSRGSFCSNCTTDLLATTTETERQGRTRNRCNGEGYESVALIPLRNGNETLGLLQLNDRRRNQFSPELISFLESAAVQIAIALSQRQAQAAQKESEEHYRSLFENMLNGFAFCRMLFKEGRAEDFIYLDVNGAFETLTGLKDVVGRRASEVIPGIRESDPGLLETYGRVALTGRPERFETYVAAMDMWFSISVYCPRREHFVAVFDVITERKKIEAAHQLLASAVDQAAEMIVITDPAGSIQYVNPAFEDVTGYSFDEVKGKNPSILKSGEHAPDFYKGLWNTITGGNTWKGHFVNKRKDGTRYSEDAAISPVRGPDGAIVNYVAVKRDDTREHHLEEQLRQAQKMESIGRLAGGVAHDFNNMLQVINSYAELSLTQVEDGNPLARNLQQIRKAARRSADLVGQLLAFARKQTVSPKVMDVNDAVAGALKMLQRLIGEDIELIWKPGASAGRIKIDPSQLDQILANLAVNARDAIAGVGKLIVETEHVTIDQEYHVLHPGFAAGEFAMLALSDTGSGMSRETMSHLFEPFFTTKEVGKGTGLGLATVYGIIKQNNGFIDAYSELGRGTTFRVYLPKIIEQPADITTEVVDAELFKGTETILVVEDETAILELSKTVLEGLGYTVLSACTPVEALQVAADYSAPIQLLITDVVMPQMNGRDLADRLTEMKPGLRSIFMSGYTADIIAHQGVLEQGVHFIPKPFTVVDLAKKVRQALG
jgi:two-component system cell cycle sensor histidine kinase/response regulator CckA